MKVLEINICSGTGSTGRIAADIGKELIKHGDSVAIAYGRGMADSGVPVYQINTPMCVRLDVLQTRLWDNAGFNSKAVTKRFIRWIDEYDPDLIHLHNIHGYYINIEILFHYLKAAGKPVVWTLHDCWPFTGHCTHFDLIQCEKWKTGCAHCPQRSEYPKSIFLDASSSNYRKKRALFTGIENMTVVTPSEWLAGYVKQSFLGGYPVEVIRNGIDLSVFRPVEQDIRERYELTGKTVVLCAANNWGRRKGYYDILQLAEMLPEDHKIVMIGLSEKQLAELPPRIIGIRRTGSTDELAAWYTAADVFLNPTYEDNYPTVNLEAQACGTPVITYRTGGSPESVFPECVAEKGDIEQVFTMLDQKVYMGKCRLPDTKEIMARKYSAVYQRCINKT